ncbi:Selenocysteine lyase/Cysteine desulfurase [Monaibacterium marinum]|uniref:Selenocysteine lyase/Cysteine desulfurase n=1 Tax=Pontivivens marinum TaxID=1690039 RepID=A0A2C9CRF2_9RHOB|nr:aminotransferase class V-fold PLP-dependent enzyme [Monaibacterium marinum]SOH93790.1 Selenocysteine lyase/Cysteine desulfurase [Monaibacterium marinum]
MTQTASQTPFDRFRASLQSDTVIADLTAGLIGHHATIDGPLGKKPLIYADYVASGRALRQIEDFVLTELLPFYANSHTEASYVGGMMTRLRREARDIIRAQCNASQDHAVIFTGSGATAGINRLVHLLGLADAVATDQSPVVLIGPYEHHSNILPWRESGAEVIEIPEAPRGGPCLDTLRTTLDAVQGRPIIGAFSAASNVTGIVTDVTAVTRMLKAADATVIWDYAGAGPYLPIDLCPAPDALIDAVVMSPHKFVGGPQASGVMIVRQDAVLATRPTLPGGGTVRFVSPIGHDYTGNVEAREEAGTPNVIGDIRAALCLLVKDAVTQDFITERNRENRAKAMQAWADHPMIELLGNTTCERLPIFSFRLRDGKGGYVHQQLVTRLLSDCFGIQARGGCACAGPYVHRVLGINDAQSEEMRQAILSGHEVEKPGFVRLNFSFLATDAEVETILTSVIELANSAAQHIADYNCDPATAIFTPA